MDSNEIIQAFDTLSFRIRSLIEEKENEIIEQAAIANPWFIRKFIKTAFKAILKFLEPDALHKLLDAYDFPSKRKNVGLVMAGNIPLVGAHDLICVLLSGHTAIIKPSHQDSILTHYLVRELIEINTKFLERLRIVDRLEKIDAVIATGSDNTARYFKTYFSHLPHIIRKNRTSTAVLDGRETNEQLRLLADDIFLYFGLGCRNVSKLFLPINYDIENLFNYWSDYQWINNHAKYYNNYLYRKSISQINNEEFIDGNFFILKKTDQMVSPLGVLYYDTIENNKRLYEILEYNKDKIQCIVTGKSNLEGSVPFGNAQFPDIDDFPDKTDTMEFLADFSRH